MRRRFALFICWAALILVFPGAPTVQADADGADIHHLGFVWEGWRPATCMPDHCFCEQVRDGAIRPFRLV